MPPLVYNVQVELNVGNMNHLQKAFWLIQTLLMHHASYELRLCAASCELHPECEVNAKCDSNLVKQIPNVG